MTASWHSTYCEISMRSSTVSCVELPTARFEKLYVRFGNTLTMTPAMGWSSLGSQYLVSISQLNLEVFLPAIRYMFRRRNVRGGVAGPRSSGVVQLLWRPKGAGAVSTQKPPRRFHSQAVCGCARGSRSIFRLHTVVLLRTPCQEAFYP